MDNGEAPNSKIRRQKSEGRANVHARPRFRHQLGASARRALRRRRGIRQPGRRLSVRSARRPARSERRPPGPAVSRRLPLRPRGKRQGGAGASVGQARLSRLENRRRRRRHDRVESSSRSTTGTARLALSDRWKNDLSAQCWLWKDHTGWREAAKITELSAKIRPQYIAKCGGVYSSEWFWSKIWHCLNVAPAVFEAAYSWVEIADWIPSVLAGVTDPLLIKRGVCAAGHKALYSDEWGGLPDKEFLARARSPPRRPAGPTL